MPEASLNSVLTPDGLPGRMLLGRGHRGVCSLSNMALVIRRNQADLGGGSTCGAAEFLSNSWAGKSEVGDERCVAPLNRGPRLRR
jgi:hypothetical protein